MLQYENTFLGGSSGGAYLPSFDFDLFDLPSFSPLQANEFGVETSFRANTPSGFADFSLDRLLSILRTPNPTPFPIRLFTGDFELENMLPFFRSFQSGTGDLPGSKTPTNQIIVYPSGSLPPELQGKQQSPVQESGKRGCNIFDMISGKCQPAILSPTGSARVPSSDEPMVSDGKGVLGTDSSKSIGAFFSSLPAGSGIFLLAIVALIFLFLFVRK